MKYLFFLWVFDKVFCVFEEERLGVIKWWWWFLWMWFFEIMSVVLWEFVKELMVLFWYFF